MKKLFKIAETLCLFTYMVACNSNGVPKQLSQNQSATGKDSLIILINKLPSNIKAAFYNANSFEFLNEPIVINNVNDSNSETQIQSKTPMFLSSFLQDYYYVKPGDKLEVREETPFKFSLIDKNNLIRTNELAFFKELKSKEPLPKQEKTSINSLKDFQKVDDNFNSWYTKAINFLNEYASKNQISDEFKWIAEKYIYYQYIGALLNSNLITFSNKNIIDQTFLHQFPICDSCIDIPTYKGALYSYIKIFSKNDNQLDKFISSFDSADSKLTGVSKEYLLFNLLNIYQHSLIGNAQFMSKFNSFLSSYGNDDYTAYLRQDYAAKIAALDSSKTGALHELLIDTKGKTISFQNILNQNKGKVVVLDFWASWCGPCVAEIPHSFALEKKYSGEKVCFIYISADYSKANWLNSIKSLNFQNTDNCYRLLLGSSSSAVGFSKILKLYGVEHVPRYVVYGKDGKLITSDAPRPSDKALQELIEKNL
jgi:thiol-disulfide isomerase/thioredoxin